MRLETRNDAEDLTYDRMLFSDLSNLAFAEAGHSVLLLGSVGLGKTHLATALGHIGIRQRMSVQFWRADKLFTRLRAARLDNSLEAEIRRITAADLLIIDDFAIKALDGIKRRL
jgi:DNA replication protein DnaC